MSEAEYLRAATSRASDCDEVETDEGIDAEGEVRRFWSHDLPIADILTPRGQLRHGLQLRLTAGEAKYLRDKFRQVPGSKESVLGFRVQRRLAGPFDHAWSILSERDLPNVLRRRLQHARSFSAAARAVSLVYYALVLEEKQRRWCADAGRPTRFKPSSPSPTDAVRDGSAKLGHPVQHVTREHGLTP